MTLWFHHGWYEDDIIVDKAGLPEVSANDYNTDPR